MKTVRLLAAITIFAMIVNMLPISAFADDDSNGAKAGIVEEKVGEDSETPPQGNEPSGEDDKAGSGGQSSMQDGDSDEGGDDKTGGNQENGEDNSNDAQQGDGAEYGNVADAELAAGEQVELKAGQQATAKATAQPSKADAPSLRAGNDITVNFYTDDTKSEKGPAWKDSAIISRKAAYAVMSPPDTNVVKPKPGYTLDYIQVEYTGVDDKIYPGQRGNYPKVHDPWWSRIDEITTTFVWRALPEHNVTYQYDLTGGYPSDFNPNNPPAATTAVEKTTVNLAPKPTTTVTTDGSREGSWEFTWTAVDAEGDPVTITNDTFVMSTRDVYVTGSWSFTPKKHKVTFVLNGGSMSSPSEVEVNDGDTVSRPSDDPVKGDKNYFSGWYADEKLTSPFDFTNTKIKGDTNIYAGYTKYYTIKFDLNGGSLISGSPQDIEMKEGEKVKIPLWEDPSGEALKDWLIPPANSEYIGVEIDGKFYAPGTYYEITKDATVKVLYVTKSPATYTISYDLNGGTLNGMTGTVTIFAEEGTSIILPAPTREGYTFDYWEGSHYNAGDSYIVRGNHTFTAQWKKNAVINPSDDGDSPKKSGKISSPNTGDYGDAVLWNSLRCMLTAMLFALLLLAWKRKNRGLN